MNSPAPSSKGSWLLYAGIGGGVLIVAVAVGLYLTLFKGPADLALATADGIKEVFDFTPRVMIDETVVIQEMAPIVEIAVVERPMLVDYRWTHTWLGSTKALHLQGTFVAKAGFDLREPFTIRIEPELARRERDLPGPRLLSLEMTGYRILEDEPGWWNAISDRDREACGDAVDRDRAAAGAVLRPPGRRPADCYGPHHGDPRTERGDRVVHPEVRRDPNGVKKYVLKKTGDAATDGPPAAAGISGSITGTSSTRRSTRRSRR